MFINDVIDSAYRRHIIYRNENYCKERIDHNNLLIM